MKNNLLISLIAVFVFFSLDTKGQHLLTLDEAVVLSLQSNETVKIADNLSKSEDLANHIGQVGLLPYIYLSGGYDGAITDTKLSFSNLNQPDIDTKGAQNNVVTTGINLQYNLYQGGSKFKRRELLVQNAFLKFWEAKQVKEDVAFQVIQEYLNVVRHHSVLDVMKLSLSLSQKRLLLAKAKHEVGAISNFEKYNSEVAKNSDSIAFINQRLVLGNAKRNLRILLGMSPIDSLAGTPDIVVESNIGIKEDLDKADLHALLYQRNTQLKISEINVQNGVLNTKLSKADFLPKIDLTSSYLYRNQTQTGNFIDQNQSLGLNFGVRATFSLFDGSKKRIAYKRSKLVAENAVLQSDYILKMIDAAFYEQFDNYESMVVQLKLEKLNLETAQLSFDQSQEAYASGVISGTELREAQLLLIQSEQRQVDVLVRTKIAEMGLYKMTGQLVD